MPHPIIDSGAFAVEPTFMLDQDGTWMLVVLVQSAFQIVGPNQLERLPNQPRICLTGELFGDDSAVSSYRLEPQTAPQKRGTDVVLVGHAHQPVTAGPELIVALKVGSVKKSVRVVGDREWVRRSDGSIAASAPRPFERMPLIYERAFGGWDRSSPDQSEHQCDPRNPVGVGFRVEGSPFEEGVALPNLEDPSDPLLAWGQRIRPASFGFISPDWLPRRALAGTFDKKWRDERMPALPADFDMSFYNAACADLTTQVHLLGGEPVLVDNASALGRLSFSLPVEEASQCSVELTSWEVIQLKLELDTVVIDTERNHLLLLRRAKLHLRGGPHDIVAVWLGPRKGSQYARYSRSE